MFTILPYGCQALLLQVFYFQHLFSQANKFATSRNTVALLLHLLLLIRSLAEYSIVFNVNNKLTSMQINAYDESK